MSPILGIYASQISGHLVTNSYESISTVTVGSGGATDITFSSIPSTYTHLQIRGTLRGTYSGGAYEQIYLYMQINSDTGSNYSAHRMVGNGSSALVGNNTTQTKIMANYLNADGMTGTAYSGIVLDVLDYANGNKYKTIRSLGGGDGNGGGNVVFASGLWQSTSAITSIKIYPEVNNFKQYSTLALYGIKGA